MSKAVPSHPLDGPWQVSHADLLDAALFVSAMRADPAQPIVVHDQKTTIEHLARMFARARAHGRRQGLEDGRAAATGRFH